MLCCVGMLTAEVAKSLVDCEDWAIGVRHYIGITCDQAAIGAR